MSAALVLLLFNNLAPSRKSQKHVTYTYGEHFDILADSAISRVGLAHDEKEQPTSSVLKAPHAKSVERSSWRCPQLRCRDPQPLEAGEHFDLFFFLSSRDVDILCPGSAKDTRCASRKVSAL